MNREFLDFVEDILDAMEKAELLIEGVSYEQFEADFRINFAVVRALEIIGEASKRLPDSLDYQIIWGVVKQDIPEIKPLIQNILDDYRT